MGYMDELEVLGVDVKEGLDRVMNDESLYEMMLGMFVDTVKTSAIQQEDFQKDNYDELITQIHSLKGITGNLSITPLFESYKEALGLLRDSNPGEAEKIYEKLLPVQSKIIDCIERHGGAQ